MKKALRILAAIAAPVPIIAGVVLVANNADATAQQPMISVPQNVNPAVANSTKMGDMSANDNMSFAVSLKLRNEADLQQFLSDVSNPASPKYHQYLTPAQFAAEYGPTDADVAKVTDYLRSKGMQVQDVSANRQVVDATASASQVETAFQTQMSEYRQAGREFYANATAPELPSGVANVVQGISGLDNRAVRHSYATPDTNAKPNRHRRPQQVQGFTPTQLRTAYDTNSLGTGTGQSVALWEFDGYQASNISSYDQQFGIQASAPQTVSVDGANFDQQPGDGEGEVELDIELVQAMAPSVNTFVYEAPNSDQGQVDMANQIVSDDKVNVTSISWGSCEAQSSSSEIKSTDNALQQGAAEGISFYVASGDSGSADCSTGGGGGGKGTNAVDYPASDPNVTGAGGTTLTTDNAGNYGSETAWSGSGGGQSTVFTTPSFQNDKSGQRAVPDVSLDADPNSGYAIFSAGQWQVFGGTSCAAPMWAGFTALYDAQKSTKLGNADTALYKIAQGANYGTAFHDITTGSNGGFQAGTGYDPVTGLGSFDGAGLANALG